MLDEFLISRLGGSIRTQLMIFIHSQFFCSLLHFTIPYHLRQGEELRTPRKHPIGGLWKYPMAYREIFDSVYGLWCPRSSHVLWSEQISQVSGQELTSQSVNDENCMQVSNLFTDESWVCILILAFLCWVVENPFYEVVGMFIILLFIDNRVNC